MQLKTDGYNVQTKQPNFQILETVIIFPFN